MTNEQRIAALEADARRLREALKELVRLDDLQQRAAGLTDPMDFVPDEDARAMFTEYDDSIDQAWKAARAALSGGTPLSLVERLRIIAGDVGVAYELVAQTDIDRDCLEAAARIVDLETELQAASLDARRLREALTRLGSMEAFECSMVVDRNNPFWIELEARIDYARAAALSKEAGYE